MDETFGARLKTARKKARMTQTALARKCGIAKQNISRYEHTDRTPSVSKAKALADALGIPITYLVGEDKPMAETKPQSTVEEFRQILTEHPELTETAIVLVMEALKLQMIQKHRAKQQEAADA